MPAGCGRIPEGGSSVGNGVSARDLRADLFAATWPGDRATSDRCPLVRLGIRCRGLEPLAPQIGERSPSWSTQVKNDEVLTIKEVAALLKLAEKTVYSMAQQGELPAFKVRGQWRIRRSELDRWIDEQPRGKANAQG